MTCLCIFFNNCSDVIDRVAFSSDGKTLASASVDKICLWSTKNGECITAITCNDGAIVSAIAFAPVTGRGVLLAVAKRKKVYLLSAHRIIQTYDCCSGWVCSIVFSPDGKTLAAGSDDGSIQLWNTEKHKCKRTLNNSGGYPTRFLRQGNLSLALSADGKLLASPQRNGELFLWNVKTAADPHALLGHEDEVDSVAFSSNNTLASASYDQTVRLWHPESLACVGVLRGHTSIVSIAFSRDGKTLAIGNYGGTISLWSVEAAKEMVRIQSQIYYVEKLVFSPSGKALVATDRDSLKICSLVNKEVLCCAVLLLLVDVAPYVVLDVVDLMAAGKASCGFDTCSTFMHFDKISLINKHFCCQSEKFCSMSK